MQVSCQACNANSVQKKKRSYPSRTSVLERPYIIHLFNIPVPCVPTIIRDSGTFLYAKAQTNLQPPFHSRLPSHSTPSLSFPILCPYSP
jgi:hypothetical protein